MFDWIGKIIAKLKPRKGEYMEDDIAQIIAQSVWDNDCPVSGVVDDDGNLSITLHKDLQ